MPQRLECGMAGPVVAARPVACIGGANRVPNQREV